MPQHIRIAMKLGEVRVLIENVEKELQHPETDADRRDHWLDQLLDLKDMERELMDMYKGQSPYIIWRNSFSNGL